MIKNLVIVESPAKAKTIERFLGGDYTVKSSFGHIRDLSKKDLGIEVENNFTPNYEVPDDKKSIVRELKKLAKEAEMVWLASDEDREGEAISWHLYETLNLKPDKTKRIVFHEITKEAIERAIKNPRDIDINLVNAQQARRVLDRLVGFEVSPVLWKKVKSSLSAGRVQSVAVKLIVEREREINSFISEASFKIIGEFKKESGEAIKALVDKKIDKEEEVQKFLEICSNSRFSVAKVEKKPLKRKPSAPFTTSTLQQEASRKLGFSVSQTMSIAQRLYENGHITYMRTDSVNLSNMAISAAKNVITSQLGENYSKVRKYSTKSKGAQEAHEAIRPTYLDKETIDGERAEQNLYSLIYKRTLASQMADAELEKTTATISNGEKNAEFIASGETIIFDGFLRMYMESADDEIKEDEGILPHLEDGEALSYKNIKATEQFSLHPPRYTEASLVKKMEALGIGRPSTYAPTISTVQNRGYVLKDSRDGEKKNIKIIELKAGKISNKLATKVIGAEKKKLFPSDIGMVVTDFLSKHFVHIMDYNFTAKAEEALDGVAGGSEEWQNLISVFYSKFHPNVEETLNNTERDTGERILGNDPKTGNQVIVRIARFGPVAQIQDGENVRYAGLRKEQLMETITLEEALDLFKFPKKLGSFEDKDVVVAVGRFGPYIRHNNVFTSLKKGEDDINTIDLETAIARIESKREEDKKKILRQIGDDIFILKGRFGPYISYDKSNYKLPKDADIEKLSLEECLEIINNTPVKKKPVKRKTTKKVTNKKKA